MANEPNFLRYAWGQVRPVFETQAFARLTIDCRNAIRSEFPVSTYRRRDIGLVPAEYRGLHGHHLRGAGPGVPRCAPARADRRAGEYRAFPGGYRPLPGVATDIRRRSAGVVRGDAQRHPGLPRPGPAAPEHLPDVRPVDVVPGAGVGRSGPVFESTAFDKVRARADDHVDGFVSPQPYNAPARAGRLGAALRRRDRRGPPEDRPDVQLRRRRDGPAGTAGLRGGS